MAALDVRDFRLLYIALFGTSVSYQLQRTIELWLVYDLTGSPLLTGLTGLVRGLATFVFQLAGGSWPTVSTGGGTSSSSRA